MKFAIILREAGLSTKGLKKCAETPIILYDGKNRIDNSEDVQYAEKLFAQNSNSFMDFYSFLKSLEKSPEPHPDLISVKIDEYSVIVFYKTPKAKVFSRKAPNNSIMC